MRTASVLIGLGCGVAAMAACAAVAAQAPAAGKAAPKPTRPPVAGPLTGPGSLNGVWNSIDFKDYRTGPPVGAERLAETADGKPIPYQPEAAAIVAARRKAAAEGRPLAEASEGGCLSAGMPSQMHPPPQLPIEILENPSLNQVTVLFEFHGVFRTIYLNEKQAEDPDPSYMGSSVGHWEGGALVVDTIGLSTNTRVMGVPHSDQLHLVERLVRTGPDTLEDRVTITDPKTFTRPWTWVIRLKRVKGMRIQEFVCDNERNLPDANGVTGVQLK